MNRINIAVSIVFISFIGIAAILIITESAESGLLFGIYILLTGRYFDEVTKKDVGIMKIETKFDAGD